MPKQAAFPVSLQATLDPASLNNSAKQIQRALGRITGQASEFQKSLDASTARVFAFGATTTVLAGVTQAFKQIVSTTISVEKKLIELNSILGASASDFAAFRDTVFSVAQSTGQSFTIVADAAGELARQGLGAVETAKRLEAALILTRVSGLDSVKSVNALTAAINGFQSAGLTAEQITNKLVAVDTKFAVSAKDLADAFQRTGSSAEDAGVSFDELLGLVTAVQQTTSRGGAVIGNALKSIFTRLSRGSTIEDLQALGVAIDASQSGTQKLNALSQALSGITDPTQAAAIKELAGGVYQINLVSAALKDLGSNNSIAASASLTAAQATNEAYAKSEEMNKSIAAQINSLVVGMTNLAEKVGQLTFAPVLKGLLSVSNAATDFLTKALDPEKGNVLVQGLFKTIGSFLSGPAIILFSVAFAKIFKLVAGFAKEGFKTVLAIGTQAERIKAIEVGISQTLKHNVDLQKSLRDQTLTTAQRHDLIVKAIALENQHLKEQQQILRGMATAAYAKGVRGFNEQGYVGKGGKPYAQGFVPNFASGFMPSFGKQMERQKAKEHGYTAGSVKQARIHDGNGKSFNSFVNSRETITNFTNAAGKKATIIRPPNGFGKGTEYAQGFSAGGFTPNFADSGFSFWSAVRNLVKRPNPLQFAKSETDIAAANFILKKRTEAGYKQVPFIREVDNNIKSSSPLSSAAKDFTKIQDRAEGDTFAIRSTGAKSLADIERYKVAGSETYNIGGKIIAASNAKRILGRNVQPSLARSIQDAKVRKESFIDEYNVDAQKLGGILLVSPRFGGKGKTTARMPAYAVKGLYGSQDSGGNKLFDKTKEAGAGKELINLRNIDTSGIPKGQDVKGVSGNINEIFAPALVNLANSMYGKLFNIGNYSEFAGKLGKFKSTSKGGILSASAEGAIFESASKIALSSMKEMESIFEPKDTNRPFDFANSKAMNDIFGVNVQRGEAKRLGEKQIVGQVNGLVTKTFNDPEYSQRALSQILSQRLSSPNRKLAQPPKPKTAGGGFVPNFSAVQDAIAREKSFGLSDSQIYVDQNPALRSSRNPNGFGVFNTRDEPNGSRQGINRAKREGKSPKSYGAAGGFVPNFVSDNAINSLRIRAAYSGSDPRLIAEAKVAKRLLDAAEKKKASAQAKASGGTATSSSSPNTAKPQPSNQAFGIVVAQLQQFKMGLGEATKATAGFASAQAAASSGGTNGGGGGRSGPTKSPSSNPRRPSARRGPAATPSGNTAGFDDGSRYAPPAKSRISKPTGFGEIFVLQSLFGALQQATTSLSQEQRDAVSKAESLGQSTEGLDKSFINLDSAVTTATQALLIMATISSVTGKSFGDFAKMGKTILSKGFPTVFKSIAKKGGFLGSGASKYKGIASQAKNIDSGILSNTAKKDLLRTQGKGGFFRNIRAGGLSAARSVGARGLVARGLSVAGPAAAAAGAAYGGFKLGGFGANKLEQSTGIYSKLGSTKYSEKLAENQGNSIIGLTQQRAQMTTRFRSTAGLFEGKNKKEKEKSYESFVKDLSSTKQGEEAKKQIEDLSKVLKEAYQPNEQGEIDYTKVAAANDALQAAVLEAKANIDSFRKAATRENLLSDFLKSLNQFSQAVAETANKLTSASFTDKLAENVFIDPAAKNASGVKELLSLKSSQTQALSSENALSQLFTGEDFAKSLRSDITGREATKASFDVEQKGFSQSLVDTYFSKGAKGLEDKLSAVGVDVKGSGKEFFDNVVKSADEFASSASSSFQSLLNAKSSIIAERDTLKQDFSKFKKGIQDELVKTLEGLVSGLGGKLKAIKDVGAIDITSLTAAYQSIGKLEKTGGGDSAQKAADQWLKIAELEANAISVYGDKVVNAWKSNAGISTGFSNKVGVSQALSQANTGAFDLRERIVGKKFLPQDMARIRDKGLSSEQDASTVIKDLQSLKGSRGGKFDKEIAAKIKDLEALKKVDPTGSKEAQENANKQITEESVKVRKELESLRERFQGVNTAMTTFSEQFKDLPNLKSTIQDLDNSLKNAATDGKAFQELASNMGTLATTVDGSIKALIGRVQALEQVGK